MIRSVTKNDVGLLAKLHKDSFKEAGWSLAQIQSSLDLPSTEGWLALHENKPAGFILCQTMAEQAEILTFCVNPEFRGQKLGEALLQYARDSLRLKGCNSLFLEVAADNEVACNLYKKLEFKTIGKRANYYQRETTQVDALTFE
ncbi:MAG: ribosomal protein S18-alanine N-acetyltransferase, partial [Alphaproteobacteria bacterium]